MQHLSTISFILDTVPALDVVADINYGGGSEQPPGTKGLNTLLRWGMWIVMFLAVVGIMVTGAMMVISHNQGRGSDHMGRLGFVFGGMVLALGAATVVNTIM